MRKTGGIVRLPGETKEQENPLGKYRPERDWPRFLPANKTLVSVFSPARGRSYGEVVDVSEGGACIRLGEPLETGTRLLLRILFPSQPEAFVTEATVVWNREEDQAVLHGAEFHFSEEGQRARLRTILRLVQSGSPGPSPELDELLSDLKEGLEKLGSRFQGETGGTG